MIISNRFKFIFIKTLKTAGTSIEIGLSEFCGEKDVITKLAPADELKRKDLGFRTSQNYYLPFSSYTLNDFGTFFLNLERKKYYNHISPIEVIDEIGISKWDEYYTFCVERNPWDKVISYFYWTDSYIRYSSIKQFLLSNEVQRIINSSMYIRNEQLIVDEVFDYTSLGTLEKTISSKFGFTFELPKYRAKKNKKRPSGHYSDLLTREEVYLIEDLFKEEIKLMKYKYETIRQQ